MTTANPSFVEMQRTIGDTLRAEALPCARDADRCAARCCGASLPFPMARHLAGMAHHRPRRAREVEGLGTEGGGRPSQGTMKAGERWGGPQHSATSAYFGS
jgi:hypothetical protein